MLNVTDLGFHNRTLTQVLLRAPSTVLLIVVVLDIVRWCCNFGNNQDLIIQMVHVNVQKSYLVKFHSILTKIQWQTGPIGSITVAELDWGNKEHIKAVEPPFDYIIGTDVVSLSSVFESSELRLSNSRSYFLMIQTFMRHATSYFCDPWIHGSVRVYCHCKYIITHTNLALKRFVLFQI
jgi:hypothetical protein